MHGDDSRRGPHSVRHGRRKTGDGGAGGRRANAANAKKLPQPAGAADGAARLRARTHRNRCGRVPPVAVRAMSIA